MAMSLRMDLPMELIPKAILDLLILLLKMKLNIS